MPAIFDLIYRGMVATPSKGSGSLEATGGLNDRHRQRQ